MSVNTKSDAQKRVDQIHSFKKELALLQSEGVVQLSEDQVSNVTEHHDQLIVKMKHQFDIDITNNEKQLSLGMKVTSFLGALALAASIFFLFYRFWGSLSTSIQVFILLISPLSGVCITHYLTEAYSDGYFSKLAGMVTFACFVLNLLMLGSIFNISPSENAMLVWAIFAFVLAYASDARLLLATGIISLTCFLSARAGTWFGCYWIHFGERPENFFLASTILFSIPLIIDHKHYSGFNIIYRVFSLLLFFIPVLILSNWGYSSYIDLSANTVEIIYQFIGFLMSGVVIWIGIRYGWKDLVNTGNVFFVVFLYTKFFDWWWNWMPKYLFFLIIALFAILFLFVFQRIRNLQTLRMLGGQK